MRDVLAELAAIAKSLPKPTRRVRTSAFIPRGKAYNYDGESFDPMARIIRINLDGTVEREPAHEFWCNEDDWNEAVAKAKEPAK